MIKRLYVAITLLLALFALDLYPTQLAAQSQAPNYVSDEIIVRYRDGVEESKKDLARFRVSGQRKKQFKLARELEVIKLGRNVTVEEAIEAYKQDPDVLYAEPNYILYLTAKPTLSAQPSLTLTPDDPSFGSLWGLTKISAPSAWNITTGSNEVFVVVIDTGIDYTHPDLAANMGIDADGNHGLNVAYGNSDPMDDHYHGTHVAGTIGAVGNNGIGVVGVNWNVKLLACKFFDAFGNATVEGALECLEYVKDMKSRGINIVATNNSWGGDENSQALYDAIAAQRDAGILFIAGAGNSGLNNDTEPFYPCKFYLANIICVAATRSNDAKASFSNYGRRTVHVGAPGQGILSTVPGETYASLDGTSMATPHVAGLAALLKAQDLTRDWRAIKNLILTGGNTISSMSNTITGKRINANGSMTCSNTVVQSRVQPILSTISASPGVPVNLGYLNIKCAIPNGSVSVAVSSGGSIGLLDDGTGADQASGDGIYSAQWTPTATGTYTLTFPGNDKVTVNVANPTISVTPSSLDFGGTGVGSSRDKTFTVSNTGGGILSGTATTDAPFSIVLGGAYSLSGGQSQTVTVRFSPTAVGTFLGNVNFTGGSGTSRPVSGTGVMPANITMSFLGKIRDRVGQSETALKSDGSLDGTFAVTLQAGSGNRTVTSISLTRSGGGTWDTIPNNSFWIAGGASSLDSPLLNASNGSVNFALTDGSSFNIFASDDSRNLFGSGASYAVTLSFSDGTTATASVTTASASISLSFEGMLRDRVGQGNTALGPDGALDGTFGVTLLAGSGNRTVRSIDLRRAEGGVWDTFSTTSSWIAGAASSLDAPLLNASDSTVNFALTDGGNFKIFASDYVGGNLFASGSSFTLTITFADGATATASASVTTAPPPPPPPTAPSISLSFEGMLRDRVGQGSAAVTADGALDGTFSVTLQAGSGNRTVTSIDLRRDGGGIWDTFSHTSYWVAGAASSSDAPLLNAANGSVNFALTDGGSFNIFASDYAGGNLFATGSSFTLTITFADGSTATASVSVTTGPPPPVTASISLSFWGMLRDRVGQGETNLAADGALDGTFSVTLLAGSGNRTVSSINLGRNGGGTWDTIPNNSFWVAGAASSLDASLLNASNGSVNFALTEGGSFNIFASDDSRGLFASGSSFTVTITFGDGSSATAGATVP